MYNFRYLGVDLYSVKMTEQAIFPPVQEQAL